MSTPAANTEAPRKHRPYVPESMEMKEFTFRAVLIGLFLTVCAGAHAAPYPLGTMTCADIGKFASEAMAWRKD